MFKFLLLTRLTRNFMASKPEIYAHINPAARLNTAYRPSEYIILYDLESSNTKDPSMTGIDSKNENLTASCLFIPKNLANDIVAPDLEIPGKIASACPIPVIMAIK